MRLNSSKRKNVIWVIADQLRAQALGISGDPNVSTPNIDNLARRGKNFQCAVSGAPWCCPFRGALLTSLYPNMNGVSQTPSALDPAIPTITQPFKEAGYHTAWVGKWHLDGSNSREHYVPPQRRGGFDYFMGYENCNNQNDCYVFGTDTEIPGCDENSPDEDIRPMRLEGYETDSLTELLINHIKGHVGEGDEYQPFFAALSVQPPHSPYVTPITENGQFYHNPAEIEYRPNVPHSEWVREKAAFDLAGYYGMVENLDVNIGRLQAALKEIGVDRETFIVFFSDHGDCLGSHAQWEKSSPWEESIKIPFIVSIVNWREGMKTGSSDAVLNHVDIAPTTLGLCGIKPPDWMRGYDYSHLCVKGAPASPLPEPDSAYLQQIPRKFHAHSVNRPWRGVLTRDGYKYVCMPSHEWLLFNLKDDPYEMANLCFDSSFQKEKERCHGLLERWIRETGDDFPLPDISTGELTR